MQEENTLITLDAPIRFFTKNKNGYNESWLIWMCWRSCFL